MIPEYCIGGGYEKYPQITLSLQIPIFRATGGGRMFEQLDRFIKENSEEILITGGWDDNKISELEKELNISFREEIKEFIKKSRSSWIPFGSSCDYMPDSWTENDDGFECNFDESSGWFSFACALKSYNDEVYFFVEKIVPILCSSVLHCEILYEE